MQSRIPQCDGLSWELDDTCEGGDSCNAESAACEPNVICTAEEVVCEDDTLRVCNLDGTAWDDTACTAAEACNLDAQSCVTLEVTPVAGWVSRFDNGVGVQGPWFTFTGGANDISEWTFGAAGACLSGDSVVGSTDGERPTGAFHLCQTAADQPPEGTVHTVTTCPHGDLGSILGFSFTLTGTVPFGTRAQFAEQNGLTIAGFVNVSEGFNQVLFADGENVFLEATDPTKVRTIEFQIPTADSDDISFDFCVSDLTVIR